MRDKILYGLYFGVFRTLAYLSLPALYVLSDALCFLLWRVGRYRVKVVRENLRSAFPEKSLGELRKIERDFYHHLCDNIVESIKLLDMSREQLAERVEVANASIVEEIAARKHPIMLFTAHFGNWEWVPAIQYCYRQPELSAEIYKPVRNKAFDRLMKKIRSQYRSVAIKQHSAYRDILRMSRERDSFIVGFVADHRPNLRNVHHYVEFLNHRTPADIGAEKIGRRVDAEFLYLDIEKTSRGRYRFTFVPVAAQTGGGDEYPYTTEYYRLLEKNILRQPHLWLWSHRRWLYEKTENRKTD